MGVSIYVFTCGSFFLGLRTPGAYGRCVGHSNRKTRPRLPQPIQIVALSIVSANAVYAAVTFLYYTFKPSPSLPPWKDPETLDLAMLFLTAPIGIIVSIVAAVRAGPRWLIAILITASAILTLVGMMEGNSV